MDIGAIGQLSTEYVVTQALPSLAYRITYLSIFATVFEPYSQEHVQTASELTILKTSL